MWWLDPKNKVTLRNHDRFTLRLTLLTGCALIQVIGRLHVLADLAARTLTPIARPLWWLDPNDEATFTIHDQFALGDDFTVAPVVERGATTRNVYLTQGLWRDPFAEVHDHVAVDVSAFG